MQKPRTQCWLMGQSTSSHPLPLSSAVKQLKLLAYNLSFVLGGKSALVKKYSLSPSRLRKLVTESIACDHSKGSNSHRRPSFECLDFSGLLCFPFSVLEHPHFRSERKRATFKNIIISFFFPKLAENNGNNYKNTTKTTLENLIIFYLLHKRIQFPHIPSCIDIYHWCNRR